MNDKKKIADLNLAFDVGHSSIGWAVLQTSNGSTGVPAREKGGVGVPPADHPNILGCGTVIFRADDCLASARRGYRRQRRHIRSTRQRIKRMKLLLKHLGVLSEDELNSVSTSSPWKLAASVLATNGQLTLTWKELWDVLRWYAHNRGYDANRRWSAAEIDSLEEQEDTEKLENAKSLLQKHGVNTMAETFCKDLGVDPVGKKASSQKRFKGLNAAFPREVVEKEVCRILQAHVGKLKGVDAALERALCGREKDAWQAIPCPDIKLPKRYEGGLLFGQLVPRFANRIISTCPITYAKTYQARLAAGDNHDIASKRAFFAAKVPVKRSREFLDYRWALLLANIQITPAGSNSRRLTADERSKIDARMREEGFLTASELESVVTEVTGCTQTNIEDTFKIAPDAEDALVLDPVTKYLATNELARLIWPIIPTRLQKRFGGQLRKGKAVKLSAIRDLLTKSEYGGNVAAFDEKLRGQLAAEILKASKTKGGGKAKKKPKEAPTFEGMLNRVLKVNFPTGRAPYHRNVLAQVKKEVMEGFDPRKKMRPAEMPSAQKLLDAEEKSQDGCLVVTEEMQRIALGQLLNTETSNANYAVWRKRWLSHSKNRARFEKAGAQGEAVVQREFECSQTNKWLALQTNNHLVRQRLFILSRLTDDIVKQYANGQPERVARVAIEVNRDLLTFSGMKKADIGSDTKGVLGSIKAQHYRVKEWLEDDLKGTQWESAIDGKLIWKAKVADDLGRRCPYTGTEIRPVDLANGTMDVDHIIPKSQRLTDAMEAVVITYKQINAMKGARTSRQFIEEFGGQKVPGTNFELKHFHGPNGYEQFVKELKTHGTGRAKGAEDGEKETDDKKGMKINPMYLPGTTKKHPDYIRRKKRKGYLMVKKYEKDKSQFAPRDLTVTSHITRLAQQTLLRKFTHLGAEHFVSIPGSVTGALRDARGWQLLACLGDKRVCGDRVLIPKINRKTGEQFLGVKPKGEIRGITHLHHAVDACTLGLLSHFIPKDGKLWELIALKELTDAEKAEFERLAEEYKWKGYPIGDLLTPCAISEADRRSPDPTRKWRLEAKSDYDNRERMKSIKSQLGRELARRRVVQHLPADRMGLSSEETVYRVITSLDLNDYTTQHVRQLISSKEQEVASLREKEKSTASKTEKAIIHKRLNALEGDLNFMRDFKRNAWIVHRVRNDSDAAKRIIEAQKKYDEWQSQKNAGATSAAAVETETSGAGTRKKRSPQAPRLLRPYDPKYHKFLIVYDIVARSTLVGPSPEFRNRHGLRNGKLEAIKAAKIIKENYGIALTEPQPEIVPFHKVNNQLETLGGGRPLDVLRRGQLIRVPRGNWAGYWRVLSAKNTEAFGLAVDLALPDGLELEKGNAPVKRLIEDGLEILKTPLTGFDASASVER